MCNEAPPHVDLSDRTILSGSRCVELYFSISSRIAKQLLSSSSVSYRGLQLRTLLINCEKFLARIRIIGASVWYFVKKGVQLPMTVPRSSGVWQGSTAGPLVPCRRMRSFLVVTGVTYLSMSGHISIAHSAVYTLLCAASMLIVDSIPTA